LGWSRVALQGYYVQGRNCPTAQSERELSSCNVTSRYPHYERATGKGCHIGCGIPCSARHGLGPLVAQYHYGSFPRNPGYLAVNKFVRDQVPYHQDSAIWKFLNDFCQHRAVNFITEQKNHKETMDSKRFLPVKTGKLYTFLLLSLFLNPA